MDDRRHYSSDAALPVVQIELAHFSAPDALTD